MDPTLKEPAEKSNSKMIGWIYVFIGTLIIIATVIFAVLVLTGKVNVPKVLDVKAPSIPIPQATETIDTSQLPTQVAQFLKPSASKEPPSVKLLSDEAFSKLLNLGVFYLLVMFVTSSGAKIASIGTQLVRTIKVSN